MRTPRFAFAESRLLPDTRIAGPMPWVIAIMMFLMVLVAGGGLALAQAARTMGGDLANRATVQIVEANGDFREAQAKAAAAMLARDPGVSSVRRVSDAEMATLLEPWLGGDALKGDLPVPVLIDVELRPGNQAARLAPQLSRVAPAARIDDHAQALAPLTKLLAALKWLAAALVLLMAAATAAVVVLTARSALNTHRQTIDVMHLLGATDVQIARLFQRRIAVDALAGGLLGLAGAVAVLVVLGKRLAALGSELVGSVALAPWSWALLGALPLAGMALAMLAARWTVVSALRRIL
ncbi:cell division protein [Sphingomonas sp. DBB INV C78]|uniref:cell division protein FtsX n=1 Tax=Sphingomonas sp. DBB INV C78 TaxID=3349434 RepID=UPI0036D43BCA